MAYHKHYLKPKTGQNFLIKHILPRKDRKEI